MMKSAFKQWIKGTALAMSLVLVISLLAACSIGKSQSNKDEVRTLRVSTSMGYGPDDQWLRDNFTDIYEFTHPNVKIEFIPTNDPKFQYGNPDPKDPNSKPVDPMDKLKEIMDGANPPDVVITSSVDDLKELVDENRLVPLDPLMTKDKFDTSDFVPAVIDGLKGASTDGKLYALAPEFSSSALIYNKQIFDNAGVTYPQDNMTWDQIFDLAKRVTKPDDQNPIYGFSFNRNQYNDVFSSIASYAAPLNLRMYDDKGENMTVDTDQWAKVWQTMVDLVKNKVMPGLPDDQNAMQMKLRMAAGEANGGPFAYDNFLSGKLAMAIVNYGELNELINVNQAAAAGNIKNFDPIQWDFTTYPTHQEAPGIGGPIYYNGIMGINVKAQNPDDAWDLIQFINSQKWMELKSKSSYDLVARKELNQPKDGMDYNIGAFFALAPAQNMYDDDIYRDKPNIWQVQNIGQQKFQSVLKGDITIKQALSQWQTEGNVMLQQIKENPNGPINAKALPAG